MRQYGSSYPSPHPPNVAIIRRSELAAHLSLFIRDVDPVCGAKMAMGARNIGQAPTHTAMPRVTITSPRYTGLREKRYGPMVISLRLLGEIGLTSVPSRRNTMIAQTGRIQGTVT